MNTLCILRIFHAFLSSAVFFSKSTFSKILSAIPLECQTVWLLIWSQTVFIGYQFFLKISSRNALRVSVWTIVRPDLGPNSFFCKGYQQMTLGEELI